MYTARNYLFYQTSDSSNYKPMLELTAPHNEFYCNLREITYESFVGIERGRWGWQATFNRIIRLKRLLDAEYHGWFIYVDADSYVFDLTFDVKPFLERHHDKVLIAATGGDGRRLAINAGVFFLNLAHPLAKHLIQRWNELFHTLASEQYLLDQDTWINDGINDQEFLHMVLGERKSEFDPCVLVDDGSLINYRGSFLRQVLRTTYGKFDERLAAIRTDIETSRKRWSEHMMSDTLTSKTTI